LASVTICFDNLFCNFSHPALVPNPIYSIWGSISAYSSISQIVFFIMLIVFFIMLIVFFIMRIRTLFCDSFVSYLQQIVKRIYAHS
jgi:hypothetical protein